MIVEAGGDRPAREAAEEAVWATIRRRLERAGGAESVLYMQHLLKAHLEGEEAAVPYTTYRFGLYQRLSEYSAAYNAVTGERMSWLFDLYRENSGPGMDAETCMGIARAVAEPPPDNVVETAQFEEQGGDMVFVARWAHLHEDTPVEGDFIQVLVNPRTGKVFSHHRKWHRVAFEQSER